jgi:hypothetical protein
MEPNGFICPVIDGGLGNQLFKLGAAIQLCRKYNKKLLLSTKYFRPNKHQPNSNKTIETLHKLLENTVYRFTDSDLPDNYHVYREGHAGAFVFYNLEKQIPAYELQNGNILLEGYFINPKYLPIEYPSLLNIKPNNLEVVSRYGNGDIWEHTYFIHYRLGDYVNHPLYKVNLDSYYPDCIARIIHLDPLARFIICSNESAASRNLQYYLNKIPVGTVYTLQNPDDDELDTLYIMSQCRGGICSNSTFSWLGCYFQKNCQVAYMPYPWVNYDGWGFNDSNTYDIYPSWAIVYDTQNNSIRMVNNG